MTKEEIILVLSCLGIAQALFLCIYLFTLKKGNRKANIFLALFLLGLTIRIGKSVLNVYIDLEPWHRNLGLSGILLAGPFLWLYGRILFQGKKKVSSKNYFHALPFLLFVIGCGIIPNSFGVWSSVFYLFVFTHLLLYLLLSVRLLFVNRDVKSSAVWKWYRNLVIGGFLIWGFYMGNLIGIIPFYIGGAIFFSLLVYLFSFLLLKRSSFALEKYGGSTLDSKTSKKIMESVRRLMEDEELFLESTISLDSLSKKLNTAPREVSQAINENTQQNFSEFINNYRIKKAKKLLIATEYLREKIATVAYDSGFGNVTSFNLAFKASTQLTPSQYRKQHEAK